MLQIERLYGKKMVAKAKTYAGKHHVAKTPQEIAQDILLKNGYAPVAQQHAAPTGSISRTKLHPGPSARGSAPVIDLTEQDAPTSSPELTKEQQELIERRRQDALERRRRALKSAEPSVLVQPHQNANARNCLQPSIVPATEFRHRQYHPPTQESMSRPSVQSSSKIHRVITPDNLPTMTTAAATEQERPEYFWDDLEAAAEIVQWENEHMAEVTLDQSRVDDAPEKFHEGYGILQDVSGGNQNLQPAAVSRIPSISQELAAAADIIQWENEHELPHELPEPLRVNQYNDAFAQPRDTDHDAPQFRLLPVYNADEGDTQLQDPSAQSVEVPIQPRKEPPTKPSKSRKRLLEATPQLGKLHILRAMHRSTCAQLTNCPILPILLTYC
ncbi:unnamed protein product [Phytophthora fragariaefolia]|uniref:Unnamed protein product n=1 Tax=Phytophthora fragariaefolia TaxID=1490495 RepID=A0A9W7CYA1_9STRA|nr:unnamed protein product [Phytophthora fragariaefolia]